MDRTIDTFEQIHANRATHCVKHICFPPKDDECMFCGARGVEIDLEPCEVFTKLMEPHT